MIQRITVNNDNALILSFNECGYQEILDNFKNASRVRIVTYNISGRDKRLLDALNSLEENIDVKIISNIPNRFSQYYSDSSRMRARETVNNYLEKLDPEKYDSTLMTYFNFHNHSKIIMTDSIAYIGSANYSTESDRNFESGIITKDKKVIDQIETVFFSTIENNSIRYYGTYIGKIYVRACEILSRLNVLSNTIKCAMYVECDFPFIGLQYKDFSPELSLANLEDLELVLGDMEKLYDKLSEHEKQGDLTESINEDIIPSIRELIEVDTVIYQLAKFSEEEFAERWMEKNGLWADEDHLDKCQTDASSEANEKQSIIAENAKNDIDTLLSFLDELENMMVEIVNQLSFCERQYTIENT